MDSAPRRATRIAHLDGIRGIAIGTVFLIHWGSRYESPVFTGGYIGVDVFFVLSGFIITTLLVRRGHDYRAFLAGRFRRLYPPLLGLLVFATLMVAVWPDPDAALGSVWRAAVVSAFQLASPAVATGHSQQMQPFVITWSLAIEWYFYLLWPFAVVRLAGIGPERATRWCVGAALAFYAVALPMNTNWFYYGPVVRFGEMAAGAALAFWTLAGKRTSGSLVGTGAWLAVVFLGGWTVLGPTYDSWAYRLAAVPAVTLSAVALIAAGNLAGPRSGVVRFLEWRPLVLLGGISYTLYLWHALPILVIPVGWHGHSLTQLTILGLAIVAVTVTIAFVCLEKPFRHRRSADLRVGLATPARDG